jgi:DNA polymerase-3 subunit alpha
MDWIPEYVKGKRNPANVQYAHPLLQSVCQKTYGVLIYQEQVMEAARVIAGYSMGGADILRRAMGKKKVDVMNAQREIFVEGAAKNGIDGKKSNEIFDILAKFAGYGFNKSHSISYAIIAYQTAYLKAHYPVEFFASILSSELGNPDKISFFISEAQTGGIEVLGPDINDSAEYFTPLDGKNGKKGRIRFGLAAIRGIGTAATENILQERQRNGLYGDFADFVWRMDKRTSDDDAGEKKTINRRVLQNLIACGSFDEFSVDRQYLLNSLKHILQQKSSKKIRENRLQCDLFAQMGFANGTGEDINPMRSYIETSGPTMSHGEKLHHEKDLLGFYISGHPLDIFLGLDRHVDSFPRNENEMRDQQQFTLIGSIGDITKRFSKNSNRIWANVQLNGRQKDYSLNFFPENYDRYLPLLVVGALIVVKGVIRIQEERRSLNVLEAYGGRDYLEKFGRSLRILLEYGDGNCIREFMDAFAGYVSNNEGNVIAEIIVEYEKQLRPLQTTIPLRIALNWEQLQPLTTFSVFRSMRMAVIFH